MQVKEMRVSRGAFPSITKAGTFSIPSPITKAGASASITKAGASPIPYIERQALEWCVSISYPPYKARSQLGQNSGGAQSCPVLTIFFSFWMCPSKILAVMKYNSGKG
jgi:hypothetical protein